MIISQLQLEEGIRAPRFYLSVRRLDFGYMTECRFFLIAPFYLLFYILQNVGRRVWRDLADFIRLMREWQYQNRTK